MYECFHCGSRFEDFGYDGEGIVHVCHCCNCGAHIEYYISLDDDDD